jgi:hypothetical protein
MEDYKVLYTTLFNSVTDAIELLKAAQIKTEGMYISQGEVLVVPLNQEDDSE